MTDEDTSKIIAVDVWINGTPYTMERVDLWNLHCIVETCFNKLPDPLLEEHDETNHQKVMESVKK